MRMMKCEICGRSIQQNSIRQKYCLPCAIEIERQRQKARTRRKKGTGKAPPTEQERNIRQQAASYKCKELRFSMRYTFDELIRLANNSGTSYGKLYAWINDHKRLPEEGEALF